MSSDRHPPQQSAHFLTVAPGERLHLRRIHQADAGQPVLMLHGAIANARTFYSERGRGLGPWLAARGFDVYVLDLRGRGLSTPAIGAHSQHGQTESIQADIPAALAEISRLRGDTQTIQLVAHSWGGVLLSAMLARHPQWAARISASVYLGSKRSIQVWNWPRVYEIELFWQRLSTLFVWRYGYLPAARLGMGADSETRQSLRDSRQWVRARRWIDAQDGFDYSAALATRPLPPTLYLAGGHDPVRGHIDDVRRFMAESGPHEQVLQLLGRGGGLRRDYGHLDMLTHAQAEQEVYPLVLEWLQRHRVK